MMSAMSAREFAEWIAFDRLEPIGEIRADFRIGQLCALLANIVKKRGQSAAKPVDFMPFHSSHTPAIKSRAQTPAEMTAVALEMVRRFGGTVVQAGG